MPSASLDVGTARLTPRPANRSLTLPIEITPIPRLDKRVQQRRPGRFERVVVTIGGAREGARHADERPCDDAANTRPARREIERRFADSVLLRDRDHVFMRGDLKHAVGRRIDDRLAGPHVLGAEPVDDLGAGGDHVAQGAAANAPLELGDELRRKPGRKRRKWPVQHDAHHLPVSGDGILAGRHFGHPAVGAARRAWRRARRAAPDGRGPATAGSAASGEPAARCCRGYCCPRRRRRPRPAAPQYRRCRGRSG